MFSIVSYIDCIKLKKKKGRDIADRITNAKMLTIEYVCVRVFVCVCVCLCVCVIAFWSLDCFFFFNPHCILNVLHI